MQVTTIGVDLAKNIFQVHGMTESDEVAFNRPLRRAQVLPFFARLDPCLVGMEACSTSHYWARELTRLGHEVRLIPPMYVKPRKQAGHMTASDKGTNHLKNVLLCRGHPHMPFVHNAALVEMGSEQSFAADLMKVRCRPDNVGSSNNMT